jgi:hypothetical protein
VEILDMSLGMVRCLGGRRPLVRRTCARTGAGGRFVRALHVRGTGEASEARGRF